MVTTATITSSVNAIEPNKSTSDAESSGYTKAQDNNAIDYVNLSMDQKISIVQKAIDDSRTNPSNKIIIPGAADIAPDVYYPNTTKKGKPLVDNMPRQTNRQVKEYRGYKPINKNAWRIYELLDR